jgi:hypothetical protein
MSAIAHTNRCLAHQVLPSNVLEFLPQVNRQLLGEFSRRHKLEK